ncbi:DUF481 domain-containing protein [Flammeovirga sp. SubArs3]|uniref:DUF481 domain-containing protein n=1 Tax=Flammeovirga sp. SubArs3 TaxID=2995316 RepID=UPI00248B3597|nr:DUF481 domain-containing protein [Flammeovirga sp. SubArs3]
MKRKPIFLFTLFLFLSIVKINGQTNLDTLTFNNGDVMIGEIKSFNKGVFTIKTEYSDSDFQVKWKGLKRIQSKTDFIITLENGNHFIGNLRDVVDDSVTIQSQYISHKVDLEDLVHLQQVHSKMYKKLQGGVDLGFSFTKANHLSQITASTNLNFTNNFYQIGITMDNLSSTQDDVDPIQRNNANVAFAYFLQQDYFLILNNGILTNTEQSIDLRYTLQVGSGKYLVHTNKANWGMTLGVNYLTESFTNDSPPNQSIETFLGTQINIFDVGDIDIYVQAVGYKSITETDRWRCDGNTNFKYNLPFDLYLKFSYSMNYDTNPAEVGKELDFVFTTSFGWNNK